MKEIDKIFEDWDEDENLEEFQIGDKFVCSDKDLVYTIKFEDDNGIWVSWNDLDHHKPVRGLYYKKETLNNNFKKYDWTIVK